MTLPRFVRLLITGFPFLSLVLFPWPLTVFLMFLAGLIFPPLALLAGILADILYYPGSGLLKGTLTGLFVCVLTYAVRHLYRTRIM